MEGAVTETERRGEEVRKGVGWFMDGWVNQTRGDLYGRLFNNQVSERAWGVYARRTAGVGRCLPVTRGGGYLVE